MHTQSFIHRTSALVLALCSLVVAQAAVAAAGKVLFVAGSVALERKGTRALKVGDPLDLGDVVVTGERSRAQILMADGARIALRANSRFRIDELAMPSNIQQPGMAVAVAAAGKSVGTLLKGGFSTRDGAIGKSNPNGYEMRTPIGTLGIRGTYYTAVFCRGDCADAPGLPAGQPIADGLYLAVDEGTITFNGRGLSLTLTAPTIEFIPLETSDPQQLTDPPAFLRNDGAGRLEAAGRTIRIAASNAPLTNDVNERRNPADAPAGSGGGVKIAASDGSSADAGGAASESVSADETPGSTPPERSIVATTTLGRVLDLVDPQPPPLPPQASVAVVVPPSGQTSFTVATMQASGAPVFTGNSLTQFDAPYGAAGALATYRSGTASLVGAGSSGASGLRWGRWSGGAATATSSAGAQTISLANASLHWIIGPTFELLPVLPVAGATNFVLAGGTNPTDTAAHVGTLNGAVLAANFTTQQVSTTLSLDLNGLNWFATGSGPITAGTVRFGGTFTNVLIDGRVSGSGDFNGFFSAGPTTPDQLNGVALSYELTDSLKQLGTVSGVAAFVPGTGQTPVAPTVSRDVAYSVGILGANSLVSGAARDTPTQLVVDAGGNLTSLTAPVAQSTPARFKLNTATVANTGFDAATGIRWGRWQGGTIDVNTTSGIFSTEDITGGALHWLVDSGYGAAPAIPQTGTAEYALVGNTDPTDFQGNSGTLGAASFAADFTNRTVTSALSLSIGNHNYFASGDGTFAANSTTFNGTYTTVNIDNLIAGSGNFSGFFTVPRVGAGTVAGAGLAYDIGGSAAGLTPVSGVLAFQQGVGTTVTPPPLSLRDIASLVPVTGFGDAQVTLTSEKFYSLDTNFDLTRLPVRDTDGNPVTLAIGTSTVAESAVDAVTMMRWGRWAGGDITETFLSDGSTATLALNQSSLHWIESADSSTPPVLPTTGAVTYQLAGGTTPTDRVGNLGTLNSAIFTADFTAQLVASAVNVTINGQNWVATGAGVIGAQLGLQPHQFGGFWNSAAIDGAQIAPSGGFRGFFTNPGGAAGVPAGAAFTYTIGDPATGVSVDGAAVFRKP